MDGSVSLKFSTEFEHVTNVQGQGVKGQDHIMKTSSDGQIIVLLQEIAVAEFNGDVRILIGSWEKVVHMRSTNHDFHHHQSFIISLRTKNSHLPQIAYFSQ